MVLQLFVYISVICDSPFLLPYKISTKSKTTFLPNLKQSHIVQNENILFQKLKNKFIPQTIGNIEIAVELQYYSTYQFPEIFDVRGPPDVVFHHLFHTKYRFVQKLKQELKRELQKTFSYGEFTYVDYS